MGGGKAGVHVLDILYALVVEPGVERGFAVLDESCNTVLPCCSAAEDAGEFRAGFRSDGESVGESLVRNAFGQIDKGERTSIGGAAKTSGGFLTCIKSLPRCDSRGLNEAHVHRDADFDDIDGVTGIAKLCDGTFDNIGLDACEFGAFFVHVVVITDKFQKKRNVGGRTFLADAVNPRKLLRVD